MSQTRKWQLVVITIALFLCSFSHFPLAARSNHSEYEKSSDSLTCRVLESHASAQPAATIIIFHQRDKQDQAQLSQLLQNNSGSTVEVQMGGTVWQSATVLRLKSCFGRGLLLLPPGAPAPKDGDTFLLRLPPHGNS
ncbi:MAG: hypothetical protein WBP79_10380 [Candidatus Acidiferrales bacterium]